MNMCPSWKFIIENEQTWRKVRQHYLSEFRCIDSSMLTRLNVLTFTDLLAEQLRLDTSDAEPITLTNTVNKFLTGLRRMTQGYFGTRDRLVIFGPGMGKGFINYLMWECTSIGVSTTVETAIEPVQVQVPPGQPRRSNALTLGRVQASSFICFKARFEVHNDKKFELQSLYPAPKQVRDVEERSLLNNEGNLIGQVKRRCEMGRRLIFCVSAHKENTMINYLGILKV